MTEEIESLVKTVVGLYGLGNPFKVFNPLALIVEGGNKLKVATIRSFQDTGQGGETIDVLFHGRGLDEGISLPRADLPGVFKLRDIISRCLDPKDAPELVVHFN